MKTYTFRIEEKELKQLQTIADKEYRPLSQIIRIAIKEFLRKKDNAKRDL